MGTTSKGLRAVKVINALALPAGDEGKTFSLQKWQSDFIEKLVGTIDSNGLRIYRRAFLFVPRANGKTSLIAALAIYFLLCPDDMNSEIIVAANSVEQARICYDYICSIIAADESLAKILDVKDSKRKIYNHSKRATLKVVSADAKDKSGTAPNVVIYDEYHESPSPDLYKKLRTGQGKKKQPLFIILTTAGESKHHHCYELYQMAKKVLANPELDPALLAVVYEAPEGSKITDVNAWKGCNPNYGVSLHEGYVLDAIAEVKMQPSLANAYRRFHFNHWVEQKSKWLDDTTWAATLENPMLNDEELREVECFGGLDFAPVNDLSALSLVWRIDGKYYVKCWHWLPEDTARQRISSGEKHYEKWIESGELKLTTGNISSPREVAGDILGILETYKVRQISYDRSYMNELIQLIAGSVEVVPFAQGPYSYNAGCRAFERSILSGELAHRNQLLFWQGSHCSVKWDSNGNIAPDKGAGFSKGAYKNKIDGIAAVCMGIARLVAEMPEAAGGFDWL